MVALDTQEDWLSGASKDTAEARQPNIHCNLAVDETYGTAPHDRARIRSELWFDRDMVAGQNMRRKNSIAPVAGLLLLSLLWALGALRADLLPQFAVSRAVRQPFVLEAMTFSIVAVSASAIALVRGQRWPQGSRATICVSSSLCLFVVPAVLVHLASSRVPDFTRVAIFSLVPVFTVVFEPHIDPNRESRGNRDLMAALAAVAGTLCIFPIELPRSFGAGCAFSALVLAAAFVAAGNSWGVRAASEARQTFAPCVAIAAGTAALGLAGASAFMEGRAWNWQDLGTGIVWSAAVELPGLILLFWLMQRTTAAQMSTRFLIAPLMANLAGLILLRAKIGLRDWAGLLLIALSSGWLLFAQESEPEPEGSSLAIRRD